MARKKRTRNIQVPPAVAQAKSGEPWLTKDILVGLFIGAVQIALPAIGVKQGFYLGLLMLSVATVLFICIVCRVERSRGLTRRARVISSTSIFVVSALICFPHLRRQYDNTRTPAVVAPSEAAMLLTAQRKVDEDKKSLASDTLAFCDESSKLYREHMIIDGKPARPNYNVIRPLWKSRFYNRAQEIRDRWKANGYTDDKVNTNLLTDGLPDINEFIAGCRNIGKRLTGSSLIPCISSYGAETIRADSNKGRLLFDQEHAVKGTKMFASRNDCMP